VQRKGQILIGLLGVLGVLAVAGLGLEWWLRSDPILRAARSAYDQANCAAAIPRFQQVADRSTPDDRDPTAVESRYRLAECQLYQTAEQAQKARQLNKAFGAYVQFAKIYPHSALIGAVRANVRRILDRTSPGSLASPEACRGLTILLDRAVVSAEHPSAPLLLLTCGRLFTQRAEYARAVHTYVALEIHYPDHPVMELFPEELAQVLRLGQFSESSVRNIYQVIEQRDLDRLNWTARPEPDTDWMMANPRSWELVQQWLANPESWLILGGGAVGLGLGLAASRWWRNRSPRPRRSIRPAASPRPKRDRPARATTTAQPRGINLTNGQYRLGKQSLDHLHSDRPTQPQATASPPTAQTTQHLSSTNPESLHSKPGQYRFDQLALKRQQRSQRARQAKHQPPTNSNKRPNNNKQPPHSPHRRPAAAPRRRPSQSLERQLLLMVQQNRPTAERLVDLERARVPDQSEDWYWQAAIERLIRDRR